MSAAGVMASIDPKIASVGHTSAAVSSGAAWPGPCHPAGSRIIP